MRRSRNTPQHVRELLDTGSAREPLTPLPGERRVIEAPVPPAPVQVEQRLAHRLDVIGCDDDACAAIPHELRGGTVEGNYGEDRPFRSEVLVDLAGQDAAAAAA